MFTSRRLTDAFLFQCSSLPEFMVFLSSASAQTTFVFTIYKICLI